MITSHQITRSTTVSDRVKAKIEKISAFEIANILNDGYKKRMDKSQNVDGSAMRPLKPETIAAKRAAGGISPTKPLIFTGELKSAGELSGDRTEAVLSIRDAQKTGYDGKPTGMTNIGVLKSQKNKGRNPFGFSKLIDLPSIAKYIKNIFK